MLLRPSRGLSDACRAQRSCRGGPCRQAAARVGIAKDRPSAAVAAFRGLIVLLSALLPSSVVAQYPLIPANNDVFAGWQTIKCNTDTLLPTLRMRVTFSNWPVEGTSFSNGEAYFELYSIAGQPNCYGRHKMSVTWDMATSALSLDPTGSWDPSFSCSGGSISAVSFAGTLEDNMTFKGRVCQGLSSGCITGTDCYEFKTERKIGWEIRPKDAYSSLQTCPDGLYQSSLVLFGCPAPTCASPLPCTSPPCYCSATQVIVPASREVLAFEVPVGISNFSFTVSSFFPPGCMDNASLKCSLAPLDLKFAANDDSQWVNLGAYKITEPNMTSCPTGYQSIATASDCESAAGWLSHQYRGTMNDLTQPSGCFFVPAVSEVWYNQDSTGSSNDASAVMCSAAEGQETPVVVTLGSMEISCTSRAATSIAGVVTAPPSFDCMVPQSPVKLTFRNRMNVDTEEINIQYQYDVEDCSMVDTTTGCSVFSEFEAQEAVYFWSRSLRTKYPTNTSAQELVRPYTEADWAIPWYRWQAAWNKPLDPSWSGDWNDWSFAWSRAFRVLDVNRDGWLTMGEYVRGYDMQAPVCPAGYKQIYPVILNCEKRTDAMAMFNMKDDRTRSAMEIPNGASFLEIYVTGGNGMNVDISLSDAAQNLIAGSSLSAQINNGNQIGTVTVMFSGEQANEEWVKLLGDLNSSTAPWLLSMTSASTVQPGTYRYSYNASVGACPHVGWSSGCDEYDPALAGFTAQVWASIVAARTSEVSTAAYTVDGFLPWYNWYQYWKDSITPDATSGSSEAVPVLLQWHGGKSGDGYDSMFRYADDNGDGYISPSEFDLLRNVKVKYCDTTKGYYQNALILFGTTASPNPSPNFAGTGCGTHGAEVVDVVVPGNSTFQIATLPASLDSFTISINSPSVYLVLSDENGSTLLSPTINVWSSTASTANSTANSNLNVTASNTTNSRSLGFTGSTVQAMILSLQNSLGADLEVRSTYSYQGLGNCAFPPVGCTTYDYANAKTDALAWSKEIATQMSSATDAWTAVAAYRIVLDSIPLKAFRYVWCKASSSVMCLNWLRGFRHMDDNGDGLVSEAEFRESYELAGSSEMVKQLLGTTCMPTNQYTASDFPLPVMPDIKSCHCEKMLGEGWNTADGMCMKRSLTNCGECAHQTHCASMQTAAGDGLRDEQGDCTYYNQAGFCKMATDASLSYPVAIALDEENNMYIADYGNNRVRVVSATTKHIDTIAGSGRLGFGGDGGPGDQAQLRHPEGIAVNMIKCTTNPREVYFSDFFNQRIRKVTLSGTGANAVWTISTVVGTGEKGQNDTCDSGCPPLQAILHNPRALAFSLDQDLFIVDAGNRKIRKLSGLYGNQTQILSTFIGLGVEITGTDFEQSMKVHQGWFLSGHWVQNNREVALKSIFNLQVDMDNNLWFADASNNRMYMAPLKPSTSVRVDGHIGRFLDYYKLHFHQGLILKYEKDILSKMAIWLPEENPPLFQDGGTVVEKPRSSYEYGKSYWMFGSPLPGTLCKKLSNSECSYNDKVVQFQAFSRLLGHCFDRGGDMYIGDQDQSLIMKVSQDPTHQVSTKKPAVQTTKYEKRNCPCHENWIDWEDMGLSKPDMSAFPAPGLIIAEQLCNENTVITAVPPEIKLHAFMQKPCTVTDFCTDGRVPWCFVDATAKDAKPYCAGKKNWGYCPVQGEHEVTFKEVKGASILGHEMRKKMRCNFKLPHTRLQDLKTNIQWYDRQVTTLYACDTDYIGKTAHTSPYNVLPWSEIKGFEDPESFAKVAYGPSKWLELKHAAGINKTCNGLTTASDTVSTYCVINSELDFDKLIQYGNAMIKNSTLPTWPGFSTSPTDTQEKKNEQLMYKAMAESWLGIVLVWSSPRVYSDPGLSKCEDRCRIDPECKAYIVSPYQVALAQTAMSATTVTTTSGGTAIPTSPAPYTCMLYSETWPYSVYKYNSNASTRNIWSSPLSPIIRMFNFNSTGNDPQGINNAYINTVNVTTSIRGLIGGPYPDKSLLLGECKAECAATTNCVSIAFPGCYLFDNTFNWTSQPSATQSPPAESSTTVWIKQYTSVKVSKTTGAPGVYAFSNNMNGGTKVGSSSSSKSKTLHHESPDTATDSLINRPGGCAFNSEGSLFFADTWNHRIRKISKMHVECQYNMELFTTESVRTYRNLINDVDSMCFTNANAPLTMSLQQLVVQQREMQVYEQKLCKYISSATASLPTQNLLVLCTVCDESDLSDIRATLAGCPKQELCGCRKAIVKVFSSEVYLNCPSQSAYYEKWHRFISAYVTCWFSQGIDDVHYLTPMGKETLKTALRTTR